VARSWPKLKYPLQNQNIFEKNIDSISVTYYFIIEEK